MSYTTGIDNYEIRLLGGWDLMKADLFEEPAYLLAFILIDLAAKSIYGKSSHNML